MQPSISEGAVAISQTAAVRGNRVRDRSLPQSSSQANYCLCSGCQRWGGCCPTPGAGSLAINDSLPGSVRQHRACCCGQQQLQLGSEVAWAMQAGGSRHLRSEMGLRTTVEAAIIRCMTLVT
jgi:hypothetical protein